MKHLKEYVMQMLQFDNKTYGYEQRQELVRCKDCLYHKDDEVRGNHPSWLPCMEIQTRNDFFCADGKRKEGQQNDHQRDH